MEQSYRNCQRTARRSHKSVNKSRVCSSLHEVVGLNVSLSSSQGNCVMLLSHLLTSHSPCFCDRRYTLLSTLLIHTVGGLSSTNRALLLCRKPSRNANRKDGSPPEEDLSSYTHKEPFLVSVSRPRMLSSTYTGIAFLVPNGEVPPTI